MKLANRLLIFALGLITLLIAGILAIVDGRLRGHIFDDRVAELHRAASLVATQRMSGASPTEVAETSSMTLGARVTLVNTAGVVVADAYLGRSIPKPAETSHVSPKIAGPLTAGVGIAILSDTVGAVPELFVAVRNEDGVTRVAVQTSTLDRIFDIARWEVLTAGFIAAMLAMLFSVGYAIYVSGPVIQLRDLARALASRDYSKRPDIDAPGEVGDLAQSLTQLSARLEGLEAVRREFIANVSHELCSPLTIASGFAATLVKEDPPIEVRRQFARAILSNTGRMQRVIDDLLDLTRIESGGWQPRVASLDLGSFVREVFDSLAPSAALKGTSLICDSSAYATVIPADITAVRQILANLTENAIRHTTGGTITVFSESDSESVCIGVRDTGEGIGSEHLPKIFERFYRADKGRARQHGGTGLGLAIVKHMTEAHGGRVAADSIVGAGTTVRAFFPRRPSRVRMWTPSRAIKIQSAIGPAASA